MTALYDILTEIIGIPTNTQSEAILYASACMIVVGVVVSIFGIIRSCFK